MDCFWQNNGYYIGANYWSSRDSINMWENWNADVVEEDFKKLSAYGVKTLRMFLVWPVFQPLKAIWANQTLYDIRMTPGETPLPDTEAGRAGVSEEACEHFAQFCHLADKYGIKLIVGLLTGHMSFRFYAPEAFAGKHFINDPLLIKWEIRFVRYFVKRFKDEPSILAWDLGNECNGYVGVSPEQSYVWMHAITSAIRESDTSHPVVSGFSDSHQGVGKGPFDVRESGELMDVMVTHPYHIFGDEIAGDPIDSVRPCINPTVMNSIFGDVANKPCFVEEVGSIGYVNCSEETEAQFTRTGLFSTWAHNCNGFFWWCAFDQGHLDYAPYDWNNIGSEYGLFRADGSAKPVADTMKKFGDFLQNFAYADLPQHMTEAVCIVPREQEHLTVTANASFVLAKQAGFDIRYAYAGDLLPEAKLYILPSSTSVHPIFLHRLNELLEKVRNGASLLISTDTLFRRIPELTGLTIASREKVDALTVHMDGETFVLKNAWNTHVESVADSCTVLARTEAGEPFFVCNRYGKGKIYYLPYKLELALGQSTKPFAPGKAPYYRFYEQLLSDSERAVRSTNPSVLLTEHVIDAQKRIVVAVNYENSAAKMPLKIADGWQLRQIHYGSDPIAANDACVLEVEKV